MHTLTIIIQANYAQIKFLKRIFTISVNHKLYCFILMKTVNKYIDFIFSYEANSIVMKTIIEIKIHQNFKMFILIDYNFFGWIFNYIYCKKLKKKTHLSMKTNKTV